MDKRREFDVAHVRKDELDKWHLHLLEEHLRKVGELAGSFAAPFGNEDWARLAGKWHDLGKYKADFQSYIRDRSRFERDEVREEAHEIGPGKVDHTAAGALHAIEQLGDQFGRALAYIIAGHHSGLPDWTKLDAPGRSLSERTSERHHLADTLSQNPPKKVCAGEAPKSPPCGSGFKGAEHVHLWIRMLFSCLVDADFLDTESFMDPSRSELRPDRYDLQELRNRYDEHMEGMQANAEDTTVNRLRRRILADCRAGAKERPGFFSLTVPTGGGKTLASMGFALDHAIRHGKRRIIVVIPYTSIIEQTAETLRNVFGEDAVLEHHSNIDPDRETTQSKLATENWDAPIVVTTNVRLFESLFAARTSACRKLHNIVGSVLILDEAQMLPPEFLKPILSSLEGLVELFGASVVLCTATQPALGGWIGGIARETAGGFEGLSHVRELMRAPEVLAKEFRRVEVTAPDLSTSTEWTELAEVLAKERQVLCIVNTRRDCRELHALLPSDTVHLSALMCGEHRSQVVATIKARLKAGDELRVVSTQLVEAGVDLDFPVVYRALAGLDSIAQAAGRCNREGRLPNGQLGRVVVFTPQSRAPLGLLRSGEDTSREMLHVEPKLALSLQPEAFRSYFHQFYNRIESFDEKKVLDRLHPGAYKCQIQFRTVAKLFRMIDDKEQKSIIVWYERSGSDEKLFRSRDLIEQLKRTGPFRHLMRRLQRCTVNIPERAWKELLAQGVIEELHGPDGRLDLWAQSLPELYDSVFGLRLEGPAFQGDEFIC